MFNIMVVDDEKLITKGVRSKILRMDHELINQVWEENDPTKAVGLLEVQKPDIIITDMEMPIISGLQFAKKALEVLPQVRILVLSGHDDYNYVRQSFQLGAVDYLLKPLSASDLHEKINDIINQLVDDEQTIDPLDSAVSKAFNVLCKKVGRQEKREAITYIQTILKHPYYQLASISLPHNYQLSDVNRVTQDMIKAISVDFQVTQYFDEFSNSIVILNYADKDTELLIARQLTAFLKQLKKEGNEEAKIALTEPIDILEDYGDMLSKLQNIIKAKIQYEPYKLMVYDKLEKVDANMEKALIERLGKWFMVKDYDAIIKFIDSFFVLRPKEIRSIHLPDKVYGIILQKINEWFKTNDLYKNELYDRSYESFDSLLTLRIYLKSCILDIQKMMENKEQSNVTIIESAVDYIKDNLDKDINMAQVSNHLSMNYSYFSKLFKERMGISFKKYLVNMRMDHAKVLLNDPTIKIYEIAMKTGYDNAQNFSRAFKTHFGFSPKEYRNR